MLIEQPTWGGQYIAEFKGLTLPEVTAKKIGQCYELARETLVSPQVSKVATFGLSTSDLAKTTWIGDLNNSVTLESLIAQDKRAILGNRPQLNTLIKFTQALNNSYQVHVRSGQALGHWQAKPESWYFLEPGKATLGLRPGAKVEEYRARCEVIESFAQDLSQKVKTQQLDLVAAKQQLSDFINQDHPERFVNTINIQAHQTVDLSQGGIHHSWEKSDDLPLGNIVYEVQADVKDEHSSLRSFDQGNIKDDGSVRSLTINDYFAALDTEPSHNEPSQYSSFPLQNAQGQEVILFDNQHYFTSLLTITANQNQSQDTQGETFHHIFVQEGEIIIKTAQGEWPLAQGWSVFIPAAVGEYQIISPTNALVLKTY